MTRNPLSAHSRFGQRIRRRYEAQLSALRSGAPDGQTIAAAYSSLLTQGHDVGGALRITRQLVLERLLRMDCDEAVAWDRIAQCMTELAEFSLNLACAHVQQALDAVHGAPLTSAGNRAQLWIVGMGKLGARELNVSSDIDLIYVYDEDGETAASA